MLWSPPDQCERYRRKRAKNPVNLTDSALRIIAMTIHVTDVAIVGGGDHLEVCDGAAYRRAEEDLLALDFLEE